MVPGQRGSSGREGNVPLPTPPRVKLWKSDPGCRSVAGGRPAQVPKEMRQHSKLRLGQRRRARAGEAQWLPGPLSHSHGKRHRPSDEIWSLQLPSMTDSVGCFLNIRTHCSGKEPLFLMLGGPALMYSLLKPSATLGNTEPCQAHLPRRARLYLPTTIPQPSAGPGSAGEEPMRGRYCHCVPKVTTMLSQRP